MDNLVQSNVMGNRNLFIINRIMAPGSCRFNFNSRTLILYTYFEFKEEMNVQQPSGYISLLLIRTSSQ